MHFRRRVLIFVEHMYPVRGTPLMHGVTVFVVCGVCIRRAWHHFLLIHSLLIRANSEQHRHTIWKSHFPALCDSILWADSFR